MEKTVTYQEAADRMGVLLGDVRRWVACNWLIGIGRGSERVVLEDSLVGMRVLHGPSIDAARRRKRVAIDKARQLELELLAGIEE